MLSDESKEVFLTFQGQKVHKPIFYGWGRTTKIYKTDFKG